jgi:DNA-binding GntR family transcriptional regulator
MKFKRGITRAVSIADELRSRIISGTLPGGMKLAERDLAEEFGTSRIPVREAMKMLESEGYLDVRARSGSMVRPINYDYVRSVVEVYRVLVPIVIRASIPEYTEELYTGAEVLIAAMESSHDPVRTLEYLNELRALLQSPAKDHYAFKVLNDIFVYNRRVLGSISNFVFDGAYPTEGYRDFIRLVRSGNIDEAVMVYVRMVSDVITWTEKAIEEEASRAR